jgi:hypothetical protein
MSKVQDAFGVEITVGAKVVHSAQGYAHRHRMRKGTVTKLGSESRWGAAYTYVDEKGRKRSAYDTSMTVVIG